MNNEDLASGNDKVLMSSLKNPSFEDDIDFSDLISTVVEAKWLIVSFAAIFLVVGIFYALISTPIYQADAVLQIEEKTGKMAGLGDLTMSMSGPANSQAATEIEIIMSRNIIGQVVDKLDLTLNATPIYFPVVGAAIARRHGGTSVAKASFGLDNYAWGGERIKLERLVIPSHIKDELTLVTGVDGKYQLTTKNSDSLANGVVGEMLRQDGLEVFVSELVARVGSEFTLSRSSKINVIRSLQSGIRISERGGNNTGILEIRLDGTDKEKISDVINTIANLYLRQNVERISEEAQRSLSFLQEQLPIIKDEMQLAEVALNNYRSSKSSVDLTLETQSILQKIVGLENRLSEVDIKRSEMSKKYTAIHPVMLGLSDQEDSIKKKLKKITQRAQSLPETQQEILRLARDVEVATTIYTQLLSRAQELKVAKAGTVGNIRIIDTALATDKPIKPNKTMIALLSLGVGLFLGTGIAFLRRALHKGVEDPDSIEKYVGVPVYANIPLSNKQELLAKDLKSGKIEHSILCEHDPKDIGMEGLRSLRTNLHFALLEAKNNIVMITGPAPGVGKSFVSTNFAHTVGHSGQKVLLIDADMRKGHINKAYGMERAPGLSELIIGDVSKTDAVRASCHDNVDILTTGSIPPNPSELLMHMNFAKYLEEFSKDYDLVLIDTPPLLAVTDAAVIGRLCGTTFVLLRYGMHSMAEIQAVTKRLRQNSIEPRGFVFNALEKRKGSGKSGFYNYEYK